MYTEISRRTVMHHVRQGIRKLNVYLNYDTEWNQRIYLLIGTKRK